MLKTFYKAFFYAILFVLIIAAVHIYSFVTNTDFTKFGIFPRALDGIIGIFTGPLIHGSWKHLYSNSLSMFITILMINYFYKRVAGNVFFIIYFLTGFCVWLFGRSVYHIGASGVLYGLIAFIFWSGVFRRNIKSIILTLVVIILNAGYLGGLIPNQKGISWESHLMGAIVGCLIAFAFKELIERDEIKNDPWAGEDASDAHYYFPRDVFEEKLEEE